eukprot:NODE_2411_length_930_cov_7.081725_g1982_i0.p2 GENE.NODE_2411_length_930_cov_7.081725_g1982_i0~~NODE_2411_length_930_cov_7.081725_g1982_i0.p2  ORF type:complete len:99 (-),score=13.62 NODE_2411_length_930_cov_7.081725_g1982_i0:607-903(-)
MGTLSELLSEQEFGLRKQQQIEASIHNEHRAIQAEHLNYGPQDPAPECGVYRGGCGLPRLEGGCLYEQVPRPGTQSPPPPTTSLCSMVSGPWIFLPLD